MSIFSPKKVPVVPSSTTGTYGVPYSSMNIQNATDRSAPWRCGETSIWDTLRLRAGEDISNGHFRMFQTPCSSTLPATDTNMREGGRLSTPVAITAVAAQCTIEQPCTPLEALALAARDRVDQRDILMARGYLSFNFTVADIDIMPLWQSAFVCSRHPFYIPRDNVFAAVVKFGPDIPVLDYTYRLQVVLHAVYGVSEA